MIQMKNGWCCTTGFCPHLFRILFAIIVAYHRFSSGTTAPPSVTFSSTFSFFFSAQFDLHLHWTSYKDTHAPLTHFFCQKFGSGRNSTATHIQTLSLHLHLPPPLQIHLLHSHSPSQPSVSHLWRQTAARWNPHRSVTLVMLKQISHFKDSNI